MEEKKKESAKKKEDAKFFMKKYVKILVEFDTLDIITIEQELHFQF